MRSSLRHLSDSRRNDLVLVVRHILGAFQNTRASGKVFGLGRKLRRAADLADPEMIVLFGAHAGGAADGCSTISSHGNGLYTPDYELLIIVEQCKLARLLRCVPELNILSDSFRDREFRGREMEENDAGEGSDQIDCDRDRIAMAAMEHFGRNIDVIDQEERDKDALDYDARFGIDPPMYARELVGVPEAVIDAVRWRLQRLRSVLEMLH